MSIKIKGFPSRGSFRGPTSSMTLATVIACAAVMSSPPALGGEAPPALRPASEQFNCDPLDQDGKTLPNSPAGFICRQIDFIRQDCELLRLASDLPVLTIAHCIGWRLVDVRPSTARQAGYTRYSK